MSSAIPASQGSSRALRSRWRIKIWRVFGRPGAETDGAVAKTLETFHVTPNVRPLKKDVVGDVGSVLSVLMGALGLVLLLVCANVANLVLVRAQSRQQEFAIRAALGAGWGRIARELLVESLTLGILGGALGVVLAYAGLKCWSRRGPPLFPGSKRYRWTEQLWHLRWHARWGRACCSDWRRSSGPASPAEFKARVARPKESNSSGPRMRWSSRRWHLRLSCWWPPG